MAAVERGGELTVPAMRRHLRLTVFGLSAWQAVGKGSTPPQSWTCASGILGSLVTYALGPAALDSNIATEPSYPLRQILTIAPAPTL